MSKRINVALIVGDIRDVYSNSVTKGADGISSRKLELSREHFMQEWAQ